jgi:YVTN family beta-propeller protein
VTTNIYHSTPYKLNKRYLLLLLFVITIAVFLPDSYKETTDSFFEKVFASSNYAVTDNDQNEIARLRVGEIPEGMDINPNTELVYVANGGSNYVSVINGSINKVIANVTLDESVRRVAVNPTTNMVYAGGGNAKAIFIINGSTNKEAGIIPLEHYPEDITVDQKRSKIYVTSSETSFSVVSDGSLSSESNGFVSVIDATNNTEIKNIQVGTSPSAIAVNPDTNMIYVANNDYSLNEYNTSLIYVINGITNDVITSVPVALRPYDLDIDEKTNMIYVINEDGNRVSVIDGRTNGILNSIVTTGSYSPFGILVSSIAVNPNTNTVYTVNTGSNSVNVINASTKEAAANTISAAGSILSAVAVNPYNNIVYVTDQGANAVYVLSNETRSISIGSSKLKTFVQNRVDNIGIKLDEKPTDITIDFRSNKLYLIYENSGKITEIDGSTNTILNTLTLDSPIIDIVVNPTTHMVYAINETAFNVIDSMNNVKTFPINGSATTVNMNPDTNTIYVTVHSLAEDEPDSLYVIDGITNQLVIKIPIDLSLFNDQESISIDPNTLLLYVINGRSGLSVIDGSSNTLATDIKVNTQPFSRIAVNPVTNMVYVANENSRSVYVIDSYTKMILKTIELNGYPKSITVNPATNIIYVANDVTGIVSVISGTNNTEIKNIQVGTNPSAIAVNPDTNMIYVANSDSNTVSVIDGSINEIIVGVTFGINPPNSGYIRCNKDEIPIHEYQKIEFGTQCTAEPNKGFGFSNWVENFGTNSTKKISTAAKSNFWYTPITDWFESFADTLGFKTVSYDSATLSITRYGSFTANFQEVPPPLPPEYWATIFGVVVTSIIGSWFIPGIITWVKSKSHIRRLYDYHKRIDSLYSSDGELNADDIKPLNDLSRDIGDVYARGKITDQHYTNLKNEISVLYQEIYKKRIDSLNNKITKDDNTTRSLTEIKEDVEDVYAKGKINELHYNLLNKKIESFVKISENKLEQTSNQTDVIRRSPV